jgi:hypothetical protein
LGQHWDYLLRQIPRTLKLTALVGGHQTWFSPGVVKSARGKYRRATKPQLLTREQLDGRTNAAKVFDRLVSDIEGDLGGHDQLSTIERALVEAFAGATGGDAASQYPARARRAGHGHPDDEARRRSLSNPVDCSRSIRIARIVMPADWWSHVSLVFVSVATLSGLLTTELGYATAWDDEHTLGARFQVRKLHRTLWQRFASVKMCGDREGSCNWSARYCSSAT